jgi:hypothetical protein
VQKIKDQAAGGDEKAKALLKRANEIAKKIVENPNSIKKTLPDKNGNPHYVYGIRTKGATPPGDNFKQINKRNPWGNDYYYMPK